MDNLPLTRIWRKEEEKRTKERAAKEGLPYVDLSTTPIDREALVLIPEQEAKKARAAIVQKIGKKVELVVSSKNLPETQALIEGLKKQGYEVNLFLASLSSLKKAWEGYKAYTPPQATLRGVLEIKNDVLNLLKDKVGTLQELQGQIAALPTSELLSVVMAGALVSRASDIHIEPIPDSAHIRFRIDGVLQNIFEVKKKHYNLLLSRIKILSGLKLNIKDVSQDGRFTISLPEAVGGLQKIDVRVSILPGSYGETIVMRLLGMAVAKLKVEELGIREYDFEIVKKALAKPHGLILTTGPTGSGKTTTLYSFLNYVRTPEINIITIEDPIEYRLPGITQSQVNPARGYTFANALRAIVRQDPDVILVGEIRDHDTADIAIQAALTGHLVFSTVHTNDAAGAIPRLRDLGADEKSLATALTLAMAQRLVRKLCPHCKEAYTPSPEEKEKIKKELSSIKRPGFKMPSLEKLYRAKGCPHCLGLGYYGRTGIFEMFLMNPEIEKLVLGRATHSEILEKLYQQGMISLRQDGFLKAAEGITTIEEVERVT